MDDGTLDAKIAKMRRLYKECEEHRTRLESDPERYGRFVPSNSYSDVIGNLMGTVFGYLELVDLDTSNENEFVRKKFPVYQKDLDAAGLYLALIEHFHDFRKAEIGTGAFRVKGKLTEYVAYAHKVLIGF